MLRNQRNESPINRDDEEITSIIKETTPSQSLDEHKMPDPDEGKVIVAFR